MNRRTFTISGIIAFLFGSQKAEASTHSEVVPMSNDKWVVTLMRADVPNGNDRIYPRSVLNKIVQDYSRDGSCVGYIGVGKEVSHMVLSMFVVDGFLKAVIRPSNTRAGHDLRSMLIHSPKKIAFRTVGLTSNCSRQNGKTVVGDDYCLESANAYVDSAVRI
jgi:hypothetical protein